MGLYPRTGVCAMQISVAFYHFSGRTTKILLVSWKFLEYVLAR